jgi:macrodomain Ter protein organizer (MatP/YcbG family)
MEYHHARERNLHCAGGPHVQTEDALHKTQVFLDEYRYRYLVEYAKRKGVTLAQAIRDLIDERIEDENKMKVAESFSKATRIRRERGARAKRA